MDIKTIKKSPRTHLVQMRVTTEVRKMIMDLADAESRTITGEVEYLIKKAHEEMLKGGR
jgi:hypothetical protein